MDYEFPENNVILDSIDKRILLHNIKTKGIYNCIERILHDLDVTRKLPDGTRIIQTIDFPFKKLIKDIIFCFSYGLENNLLTDEDVQNYYYKWILINNNNIEYEKENPPIIYKKKKVSNKKLKAVDLFGEETIINKDDKVKKKVSNKKLTKEEKLKAKFSSINIKLNINR